jgi:Putative transposase
LATHIDIETCGHCGGAVKIIAVIEDPVVIEKILTHLNNRTASAKPSRLPASRASLIPQGHIRYQLKSPYRFESLDFIARLASPVPTPRVHLTRYHGVFVPNSRYR